MILSALGQFGKSFITKYYRMLILTDLNNAWKIIFENQSFQINGPNRYSVHHLHAFHFRSYHHDMKAPDFSEYRRESTNNRTKQHKKTIDNRQVFTYSIALIEAVGLLYGTKGHLLHYIMCLSASKDVLALAKIEIKLADLPEGKNTTFKWRGKPLFVWHRTQTDIDKARAVPLTELRHPQTDEQRAKNPKYLVVIGVCTHLGCVPLSPITGDFGGFYCPCHGAHYDSAGRVRKGPAPLNLVVPPHSYPDENTLVVG